MRHRKITGEIQYLSKKSSSFNVSRGFERFMFTHHADGSTVLRAACELELPAPKILRDVIVTYDRAGVFQEGFVKLAVDDVETGSGWYRRIEDCIQLEGFSRERGRYSESHLWDSGIEDFMSHPVVMDGYHCRLIKPTDFIWKRPVGMLACSVDHRGATAPSLSPVKATIEFVGEETVQVAAGKFDCFHYRYVDDGHSGMATPHPDINVWVTADRDCIYVRGEIGGSFQSAYELTSLELVEPSRD